MGLRFQRKKKRNLKLSFCYRLSKLFFFLRPETRLKLYLDLAWIFERLAHELTFKTNIKVRAREETVFLLKHIKNSDRVLDLGCGVGDMIKEVSKIARETTGVDINEKFLEAARKENDDKTIQFVHDDIVHYTEALGKNKFDAAILSHIFEHLDDPKAFLDALSGKVANIYINVSDFENSRLNLFRVALDVDLKYTDADHIYEFDRFELKNLLEECNLEIIDSNYRFGNIQVWAKAKKQTSSR